MAQMIDFTFLFENVNLNKTFKTTVTADSKEAAVALAKSLCAGFWSLRVVGITAISAHRTAITATANS